MFHSFVLNKDEDDSSEEVPEEIKKNKKQRKKEKKKKVKRQIPAEGDATDSTCMYQLLII